MKDERGQILSCTNVVMCLSTQAHNVGNATQWNVPNNIHLPPHIQKKSDQHSHTLDVQLITLSYNTTKKIP